MSSGAVSRRQHFQAFGPPLPRQPQQAHSSANRTGQPTSPTVSVGALPAASLAVCSCLLWTPSPCRDLAVIPPAVWVVHGVVFATTGAAFMGCFHNGSARPFLGCAECVSRAVHGVCFRSNGRASMYKAHKPADQQQPSSGKASSGSGAGVWWSIGKPENCRLPRGSTPSPWWRGGCQGPRLTVTLPCRPVPACSQAQTCP